MNINTPFELPLADGSVFVAEQVVRLLPKRRVVAFGHWQNRPAVGKFFIHPRHADRNMQKDLTGVESLKANQIPTPSLYYQGKSADQNSNVLIFERILRAKNLEEILLEKLNNEDELSLLKWVIIEIATQHVLGVMQDDLHFKNFLITEKKIYTLDGGQIKSFPEKLERKASIQNLALFLSQLGVGKELTQEILFKHYAAARGWIVKNEDVSMLFRTINQWNKERWRRFKKKIFRTSSAFVRFRHLRLVGIYDRHYASPEFMQILSDPESAFTQATAKTLKAGRSATVVKVTLDNKEFVVKRYNLKNTWHRVRRFFRRTRAATSWCLAQKLRLFGVATARPAAFIESRVAGLRGKSYYITEYVTGELASEYFYKDIQESQDISSVIERVASLLNNLKKLKISHGDLKSSNVLITMDAQPVLIDLDGATEHTSGIKLRKGWQNDVERFMKNFQEQPSLQKAFKAHLFSS